MASNNTLKKGETMTEFQIALIDKLTTAKTYKVAKAVFNGDFLNCEAHIQGAPDSKGTRKVKKQKFSFVFDSAEDCQGARQVGRMTGAYAEHYAKAAFEVICKHSDEIAGLEI